MITCTKYFHVRVCGSETIVLFRAEYFDIVGDEIFFWVGDLLLGSCFCRDVYEIKYLSSGSYIVVDDFDEEGRYGND